MGAVANPQSEMKFIVRARTIGQWRMYDFNHGVTNVNGIVHRHRHDIIIGQKSNEDRVLGLLYGLSRLAIVFNNVLFAQKK